MKKSFDAARYQKAGINDLILFSISSILKNKEKCTFEKLTKECFSRFPKVFSFSRYSQWPDSRKLDRALRTLRIKKMITGNPTTHFSLTKAGKHVVEETAKILHQISLFK